MSRRNPCKFEIRGHCLNGKRCHFSHNYFEWPPHALLVRQNFMLNRILKSMDKSIDTLSEISGAAELDRTEEYALGVIGVLESYIGSINNITKQSACVAMSKLLTELNSDDIKKLRDHEEPNSPKVRVYNTVISYIESNRKNNKQTIHLLKRLPADVLKKTIKNTLDIHKSITINNPKESTVSDTNDHAKNNDTT
uniref:Protein M2-1 n=1 Tax=Human respiratory syncytial virus A TaxID=208893 RepID=A0A384ZD22_HSRVX|nr:matrix protein M2-1 [Human respiratory syncytial virus A]